MQLAMAGVKFDITGNANGFITAARQAENAANNMVRSVTKEGDALDDMFKKLAGGMSTLAAGFTATELTKKIFNIRSEFQQLEVAFSTMLKSKEKADKLMRDATEFAATTPFDLKGVAAGIKKNLAYGASVETVIDEMRMLGDVAAGVSMPLNDLVYLYGTLRTSGRVATIDIRQFAGRGIPIYEELAKVLGVAKNEVAGLVTAGKVGFADIEKAFQNMTSEGGMFANLMANQSKTLQGQFSNLKDNIEMMFNEIGQSTEGVFSDAISAAGKLVEHYQSIGRILSVLVATYGTYKAALIAVAAIEKVQATAQAIKNFIALTKTMKAATAAQLAFNSAAMANPYVLIASAIAALISGLISFTKHKKAATEAQKAASREVASEVNEVNNLAATLKNANTKEDERRAALERLKEISPEVVEGIDLEKESLEKLSEQLDEYNTLKSIEIALKASMQYIDFSDSIQSLNDLKTQMQEKKSEITNVWVDFSDSIRQAIDSGSISDELSQYFESFMYDQNIDFIEKVQKARYAGLGKDLSKEDEKFLRNLFYSSRKYVSDFMITVTDLRKAETKYTNAVESLRSRIHNTISQYISDAEEVKKAEEIMLKALGLESDDTTTDNTDRKNKELTEKQKENAYKRQQAEIKASESLAKMKRDLNAKVAKADIDSMEDGYTKTMKTLKYNLQSELDAIEDQKKKLLKSKRDEKMKSWLAEDSERKEYQFVYTPTLTADEEEIFRQMGAQAQKEFNKGREEAEKQYGKEAEFTMRQFKIDSMEEGTDKKIAQRKLDNDKELHNLEMQREAYIEAAKAAHILAEQKKIAADPKYMMQMFDESKANADFDAIVANTEKTQAKETAKETYDELLGEFKTYQQQRADIEKKFAKQRESLYTTDASGNKVLKEGVTKGNIEEIDRAEGEELKAVDQHFAEREESYRAWMNHITNLTLGQLEMALAEAEEVLKTIEDEDGSSDKSIAEARAKVATLRQSVKDKKADENASPSERTIEEWNDLREALEACNSSFDQIGDSVGGVAGEVLSATGAIVASTLSMVNGVMTLVTTFSTGAIATAQGAAKAIKIVETASVILAILSAAIQIVMRIIDAVKKIFDADNQAEIEKLTEANEELDESYKKLERDIKKAYSVDASDLISQQNTLLEQKKKNLELMIAEEEAKKDSDSEQINQWQEQLGEIEASIEDNSEKAQEAISGISFDDFRNRFLDALLDMEDGAEGFSEDIEEIIREAMYNALLAEKYQTQLDSLYDDLAKAVESGDTSQIARIKAQINDLYDKMQKEARDIDEKIGYESPSDRSASEKGIAQASQNSVDELNGRMTAIQSHTFSINQNLASVVAINAQILGRVSSIDGKTSRLETIEKSLDLMRSDISDILTRGIKVKA